jgi:hypothetical protein
MPLYRKIISQSLKITWRYKYLWFFGVFAAILGSGGEYEILINSFSGDPKQAIFPALQKIAETGVFSSKTLVNIGHIVQNDPLSLLSLIAIYIGILALMAFLFWLAVISQSVLVNSAAAYQSGRKPNLAPNFGERIRASVAKVKDKFWQILGLNLLVKVVLYASFILVSLPIIFTISRPEILFYKVLYFVLFILFIPFALSLSLLTKYSIAYSILKNNKFFEAIKSSWGLFKENWIISVEMAFILFLINFLASIVLILAVLSLAVPFLFLGYVTSVIIGSAGAWLIIVLAFIVLLSAIVLGGAVISTFQISSWTCLFSELINKGATSKIERIVEGIKEKIA